MEFYNIKDEYIHFLKKIDDKIADNKQGHRPYIGIVLEVNGIKYYAPLSSPKPTHKTMKNAKDFRKINQGIYGAINFCNMIPVVDAALSLIDIAHLENAQYRRLLQNQAKYINADAAQIQKTAEKLHALIFTDDSELNGQDQRVKKRCCNLPALEHCFRSYIEDKEWLQSAIYKAQQAFAGVAEQMNVHNEDDVQALVDEVR